MDVKTLPTELQGLVNRHISKWSASVRLWKNPNADADMIARSDEYADEACLIEGEIRAFVENHNKVDGNQQIDVEEVMAIANKAEK